MKETFLTHTSSLSTVRKEKRKLIPAVTHFDNTARLQTVKDYNEKYSNLISYFYKLTKVPVLLNTSFNENEPIVLDQKKLGVYTKNRN